MNFPLQAPRMRAAARRAKAGGERFLGGVLPGATARRLQVAAFADEWAASNLDARQANGPLWIVLGDSISQGIGATTRESGYVGVVHDYLRRRDAWRVINLSRAEAGVLDVLARQLPELNSIAATEQIALVTCLIGAEDMARRTPGLDTALRQVISALPTGSVIGLLPHGPRAAGALNSVIREEAERHAMRIAVLPPRLPGQLRGRDNRGLGDVGHAAFARAVLTAADGPVAVAAPATDPRLPVVPPLEDHSPPTDPAMPVVPPVDSAAQTTPSMSLTPPEAEPAFDEEQAAVESAEVDAAVVDAAVVDDLPVDEAVVADEAAVDEVDDEEPVAVVEDVVVEETEPVVSGSELDEVVVDEVAPDEIVVDEAPVGESPVDEVVVEESPVVEEPVVEEAPAPAVEKFEQYEVGEYQAEEPAAEATPVDEPASGLGWSEQFGTASPEPASNGRGAWYGSDPEPVAEVEPVADDEPLEVEVDMFGETVAEPAEDAAEPTAVESPATEARDDRRPRPSDVDLFSPPPPAADAPRAYGNGDRGPNESGADRTSGYAERADRR